MQGGGYPAPPPPQGGGYPAGGEYGGYPPPEQQQYDSPQYGGQQYDSPQYGSPQHGGQQYGPPVFAPAPKKWSTGKIVAIALVSVLLLCGGGAAVAALFVGNEVKDAVDTATKTRVVAPDTLAGRPKVTDPNLLDAAKQLESQLATAVPNATSRAGAFYGNVAQKELVMIAAASGPNGNPGKTLDDTIAGARQTDVKVGAMTDVEPGPLGGEAKCGDAQAAAVPIGFCVWSDRGSVGMILIYFRTGAQAAQELVAMRGQIEQQG